jgi:hypothetical protein
MNRLVDLDDAPEYEYDYYPPDVHEMEPEPRYLNAVKERTMHWHKAWLDPERQKLLAEHTASVMKKYPARLRKNSPTNNIRTVHDWRLSMTYWAVKGDVDNVLHIGKLLGIPRKEFDALIVMLS